MLTYASLLRDPNQVAQLHDLNVLIAAATAVEVLIDRPKHAGAQPNSTMVFMHETIALMKAERAAQLLNLKKVIHDQSVIIPITRKKTSFWDNVTLGRASTADIVIEDPAVSSMHAEFLLDVESSLSVQDVGSSNGTYINREPLQPHHVHPLQTGDCIRVGQTVLYYVSAGTLEELLSTARKR